MAPRRTRAEERIEALDISPAAHAAQLEAIAAEREAALAERNEAVARADEYLLALQRERAEFLKKTPAR
jgi:hypothetical protein